MDESRSKDESIILSRFGELSTKVPKMPKVAWTHQKSQFFAY